MAKKTKRPKLNFNTSKFRPTEWESKFDHGDVLKDVVDSTIGAVIPNMHSAVKSTYWETKNAKDSFSTISRNVKSHTDSWGKTDGKRKAVDVLRDAYKDISSGEFSLEKLKTESYDSVDDFDINDSDYDEMEDGEVSHDPTSYNVAVLGNVIADGTRATLEGMEKMSHSVASIQLKSSKAMAADITSSIMYSTNFIATRLDAIGYRMDAVNANLGALVEFNNKNMTTFTQASLDYYNKTSQMIYELGRNVEEMKNAMVTTAKLTIDRKEKTGFDMSSGFDMSEYIQFVKKNFDSSMVGTLLSLAKMGFGMGSSFGVSPLSMIVPTIVDMLIPEKMNNSIKRLDKSMNRSLENLLYRIGDMRSSSNEIKSFLGTLFGKRRDSFSGPSTRNFKRDAMSWNGIAQKTLVEVIPSYLARIESAITKNDERYFNMDTGQFSTRTQIEKDFAEDVRGAFEFGMRDFTSKFADEIKEMEFSTKEKNKLQESINKMVLNAIIDDKVSSVGMDGVRHDVSDDLYKKLKNAGFSKRSIVDMEMAFMESLQSVTERLNNFNSRIGENNAGYTHLLNTRGGENAVNKYYRTADIFAGTQMSLDGRLYSRMTEKEIEEDKRQRELKEKSDNLKEKVIGKVKEKVGFNGEKRKRFNSAADVVDAFTDNAYLYFNGYEKPFRKKKATSRASAPTEGVFDHEDMTSPSRSFDAASKSSKAELIQASNRFNRLMEEEKRDTSEVTSTELAVIETQTKEIVKPLKALVIGLHDNFLAPMVGSIFGPDGFFRSFFKSDEMKEVKEDVKKELFDEKDGVFSGVTLFFKDMKNGMKHLFTGKGYIDRNGNVIKDSEDSVFSNLKKGAGFIHSNTMKYMFGENYEENETYQKMFGWRNFKGHLNKKGQRKNKNEKVVRGNFSSRRKNRARGSRRKRGTQSSHMSSDDDAAAADPESQAIIAIEDYIEDAGAEVAEEIVESGYEMTNVVIGDFSDENKNKILKKKAHREFWSKIKAKLPKHIASAIAGAGVGAFTGIVGTGLIGSLFLPTGIIGGAMLGTGLSILSESDKFKKFVFGEEDENGNKKGGLLSEHTTKWLKKSLPIIVGAGSIGIVTGILKKTAGAAITSKLGFLGSSLLPGGIIGGALLSIAIGLFKNNETIQDILFGKPDSEGRRKGAIFKSYNGSSKNIEKVSKLGKGALKGATVGVLGGAALSHAGLIGASLASGGPIGMAIMGLSLGIASQTTKFQEYLFGTEEFDENGNSKGRIKNGLLHKLRNIIATEVFTPLKDSLQEKGEKFAYWLKDNITYPFRLSFGPIVDSLKGIKKDVTEIAHKAFTQVSTTIGDVVKSALKPVSKAMAFTGKAIGTIAGAGLRMSLLPISMPLKALEMVTGGKRHKAMREKRRALWGDIGNLIAASKQDWANEGPQEGETGLFGGIKRKFRHVKELKDRIGAINDEWADTMAEQGYNTFDWMRVRSEKREDRRRKRQSKIDRKDWKKINALSHKIRVENGFADLRLSDEGIAEIQNRFSALGIKGWDNSRIETNDDINRLLYNRDDWVDQYLNGKKSFTTEDAMKYGMKIKETPEMALARKNTASYQGKVIGKFDNLIREVSRIATQTALTKRKNLKGSEVTKLTKELKEKGLTWDDIGIDPGSLVRTKDLSREEFEEYIAYRENNPGKDSYSRFIHSKFASDPKEATITNISDKLSDMADAMTVQTVYQGQQLEDDTGIGKSEIFRNTRSVLKSSKFFNKLRNSYDSALSAMTRRKKKIARDEREALESEALAGAGREEDNASEAQINGLVEDDVKKSKGGKILSGVKSIFSSIATVFGNTSFWTKIGMGAILAAIFADPLAKIADKAKDFAIDYIVPGAKKLFNVVKDTIIPGIAKVSQFIIDNMATLVYHGMRTLFSAFTNLGKIALNGIADKFLPGQWVPFPEVSHVTDTVYASKEEAVASGEPYYYDEETEQYVKMDEDQAYDEDGNVISIKKTNILGRTPQAALSYMKSAGVRKVVNGSIKGSAKILGYATGLIPGAKLVKAGAGTAVVGAKGVKSLFSALGGKVTKDAAETAGEAVIKSSTHAGWGIVQNTATEAIESGVENKSALKKLVSNILTKVKKFSKKVSKYIPAKNFTEAIDNIIADALTKISKMDNKLAKKVYAMATEKVATAAGKTAASLTGIIQAGFSAYDLVSGFLEAAYLFEVDSSEVNFQMRAISSAMKALLGLGIGPWIDIVIEIMSMCTGTDFKKVIATKLYKAINHMNEDAIEALEDAQLEMEIETENYNAENNTSLSVDAYNELKNAKWFKRLFQSKKYGKASDYDRYKATAEQLAMKKTYGESYSTTSSNSLASFSSYDDYVNNYGSNIGLGYGKGPRAIGYGNFSQNDSRWGNYKLGKFPDGSTSTMATGGCGPTALSMVANSFGANTNPLQMANYAKSNGYIADGGATEQLFTSGASKLGLQSHPINKGSLKESLGNGPVVLAGKSNGGAYTKAGHIISVSGIDPSTGKAIVNDPMKRNTTEMSVSSLENGMTHGWSYSAIGHGRGPIGYGILETIGNSYGMSYSKEHADQQIEILKNRTNNKKMSFKTAVKAFVKGMRGGYAMAYSKEYADQRIAEIIDGASKKTLGNSKTKQAGYIESLIDKGSSIGSDGIANWQNPEFYQSLTVGDIRAIGKYDPAIISDPSASLFGLIYNYYIVRGTYDDITAISQSVVESLIDQANFIEYLGGYGTNGTYEFKNGYPFFPTNDSRWADISWRGKTVGSRGSDLSSLAAIASSYGGNLLPPDYIYNNWLKQYPQWIDSNGGLDLSKVMADGGFNAMKATQVGGKRLLVKPAYNKNSILAALQSRKPVFMTGYRYKGSLFGGDADPSSVNRNSLDSLSSIVALYANDKYFAINDPYTQASESGVFDLADMDQLFTGNNALKSAFVVTDPNGKGLSGPIDISSLNYPKAQYKSMDEATGWMEKLATFIGNIVSVGGNVLDSLVTGEKYKSIFDVRLDGDGADDIGVGKTIAGIASPNAVVSNPSTASNTTTQKSLIPQPKIIQNAITARNDILTDVSRPLTSSDNTNISANKTNGTVTVGGNSITPTQKAKIAKNKTTIKKTPIKNVFKSIKNFFTGSYKGIGYGTGDSDLQYSSARSQAALESLQGNGTEGALNKVKAIMNANLSGLYGEDYTTALEKYVAAQNSASSSDGTTSATYSIDNVASEEGIWKFFSALGYSDAAVAGIMGNLYAESKLDPTAIQGGGKGPAAGIAQWENYNTKSKRWKSLYNFATANGKDWTDLTTQLQFIHKELTELSNVYWKSSDNMRKAGTSPTSYSEWMQSMNVETATRQFEGAYERAGKPHMTTRIKAANEYFQKYHNINYGPGRAIGYGNDQWISIIRAVKAAIAAQQPGYSQGRSIELTIGGKTLRVRTDCSGFVSACLRFYGVMRTQLNSTSFTDKNNIAMLNTGFTSRPWTSWEDLQEGDIIARYGHVEIFAYNAPDGHYVYNCGSDSSVNNPNATKSAKSYYTTVWSPGAAGVGAITSTGYASASSTDGPLDAMFKDIGNIIIRHSGIDKMLGDNALSTLSGSVGSGIGYGPVNKLTSSLNGIITSGYGKRNSVFGNEYHRGVDIGASYGTPIQSPVNGIVESTGSKATGYGNYAVIRDYNGMHHIFAHMNHPVGYGPGTVISENDIIGEVGSSGSSTGSHLHYEVRKNGNKYSSVNPMSYNGNDLNIRNQNNVSDHIGTGNEDIKTRDLERDINVSIKTGSIEDKMDTMIRTLQVIAENGSKDPNPPTTNTVTNTTNHVVYGKGSQKSTSNTSSSKQKTSNMTLAKMHQTIASK